MKVLITGGSGKLGRKLLRLFPSALAPSHRELDITNRKRVFEYLHDKTPETLIHCAALTSIRECESHRHKAFEVNVHGTENLFEALESIATLYCFRGYFAYLSSACVFSGEFPHRFYSESDIPYPRNFYGLTKLLGEVIVNRGSSPLMSHLIVRTNFVERGKWPYPAAFTDRFGTYLYTDQVARAIKTLIKKRTTGTVHVCGDRRISMYDLARRADKSVKPTTLKNYNGPPLTVNMCLTSKRIRPIPLR